MILGGKMAKGKVRSKDPRVVLQAIAGNMTRLEGENRQLWGGLDVLYSRLKSVAALPWPFGWLKLRRIEKVFAAEQARQAAAAQAAIDAEPVPTLPPDSVDEQPTDLVVPDKTIVGPDGRPA
jgi:hypothetical protein